MSFGISTMHTHMNKSSGRMLPLDEDTLMHTHGGLVPGDSGPEHDHGVRFSQLIPIGGTENITSPKEEDNT